MSRRAVVASLARLIAARSTGFHPAPPMHYVFIEFQGAGARPWFWTVALTQAALWTFIPAIFFSAPPGDVPMLLAIGHEFVLGSYLGPPLAFWLGEIAFGLAGSLGLYALAQACIVIAYWAVFALGRAIVGTRHAVLAVLLMVGIAAFSVPSPNFGPAILAAPLWALALLYWRAAARQARLLVPARARPAAHPASYAGLILVTVVIVFTATARGRAAALHPNRDMCCRCIAVPHASGSAAMFNEDGRHEERRCDCRLHRERGCASFWYWRTWPALLVTLASGWPRHPARTSAGDRSQSC